MSQFGLAFFYTRTISKISGKSRSSFPSYSSFPRITFPPASVYFNESPIGHCLTSVGKGAPTMTESWLGAPKQRTANIDGRVWGVCACVRPCMRACVRACVRDVLAIYYENILSRLFYTLLSYISYKSDTLMISPQRVYRLVYIISSV